MMWGSQAARACVPRDSVDRIAFDADRILVLGRTQTHPESSTGLVSGLLKMTTAGPPRVCRIPNTAMLENMWASEALLEDVRRHPNLSMESAPAALEYNESGNLW
jgi:hypothetical protein